MADIHLHSGSAPSVTWISNSFIDGFMKDLSGDTMKVYLALLRCLEDRGMGFSCSEMAGMTGITARGVRSSLDELSAAGLVSLDYDSEGELCDICVKECRFSDRTEDEVSAASLTLEAGYDDANDDEPVEEPSDDSEGIPEMRRYSDADSRRPEVKELLFITQRYFGHTMSNKDLQTILYWFYDLHMSVDMIDYLITSNIDKGKSSIAYMNKVAVEWWKKGIHTRDEASFEQKQFSSETNTVRKAFGASGHAMTPGEMEYIDRWFHEWNFAPELVEEACSRTITTIGTPNYKYANKILKGWHDKGISTLDQIAVEDEEHEKENEKNYPKKRQASGGGNAGSFSFGETNGYDDDAIAAAMLKRNTF